MALAASLPETASAQSSLDTAEAQAFLGDWSLNMDSPQGAFVMSLMITDSSGKVAASVGADELGGMQPVTNITRSGENLVLRYEINVQGQSAPVALTLMPDGAALNADMDFADGMFVMSGRATK
jgi:hypothetical protein